MKRYFIIYKPYKVLSSFTASDGKATLADYFRLQKDVYGVGRLDYDSEGLLILTNDKAFTHRLLHPSFAHERSYLVQVEGLITPSALKELEEGTIINIKGQHYKTLPANATSIAAPVHLPERNPPVRFRKEIPDSWIRLTLKEGKNRQVRKMTASVGFPTLRLIRESIMDLHIGDLKPGEIKELSSNTINRKLFNSGNNTPGFP